ncbi:MAG: lysine exporter LysO family protein [bacterium]|nr:lysine exporter LysO family protein [bacterium]
MKNSFIILSFFVIGILLGIFHIIPGLLTDSKLSEYTLYLLMLLVGIGIGGDRKTWTTLKKANIKVLLVPLTVIIGSLSATVFLSFFMKTITLKEMLAVSSGFGYYSLSSIIITKFHGETLGVIALIANLSREIITLIIAPALFKYFGKLAPIASGGATAMDTTLPIITKCVGKDYAIISVFSGVVLTILVPFIVTFFIK